jgi:hypothetical protein
MIYFAPKNKQLQIVNDWQKRMSLTKTQQKNLFTDPNKKTNESVTLNRPNQNNNTGYSFSNAFANTTTKQDAKSDFYFDNPQNVSMGITNYIKKWGDRPNVDNWRRKTSVLLIKSNSINTSKDIIQNDTPLNATEISIKDNTQTQLKENTDSISVELIETDIDLMESKAIWNKNSLAIAKIFLYELGDFEKAFPRYQAVIQNNIEPNETESALLDIASHYLHIGQSSKSDSIILLITQQFPEGIYIQKKKAKENLDRIDKNSSEAWRLRNNNSRAQNGTPLISF